MQTVRNMDEEIFRYAEEHSEKENEGLVWIRRQTHLRTSRARMLSGAIQGGFLTMLVRAMNVHKALELGTFTGYGSACIALGLPEDGHLDTLESNDELVDLMEEGWKRTAVIDKITLYPGDALGSLKLLDRHGEDGWTAYDFVYIDANKREYDQYLEAVLPMTREGGLILADNTLWGGKVLERPLPVDAQTTAVARFNDALASDSRVRKVMLPLRDGLTLIQKL